MTAAAQPRECSVEDAPEPGPVAMAYAAYGWSVFPVWWVDGGRCGCPRGAKCTSPGKHPLTRRGLNDASRQLGRVGSWWHRWPRANVGLPAGDNGLAVLDVDPRHGGGISAIRLNVHLAATGQLPLWADADERRRYLTLAAVTGSGGLHLVFRAPAGGVKGGANCFAGLPGIDVRGRGGYIVAAPSAHASGGRYAWVDGAWFLTEPAPWPHALEQLAQGPEPAVSGTAVMLSQAPAAYVAAALDGEVRRVRCAPEGERNHTLNRAAFSLGQLVAAGVLSAETVTAALSEAAAEAGLGAAEIRVTIRSGLRGGAAKPRGDGGAP